MEGDFSPANNKMNLLEKLIKILMIELAQNNSQE